MHLYRFIRKEVISKWIIIYTKYLMIYSRQHVQNIKHGTHLVYYSNGNTHLLPCSIFFACCPRNIYQKRCYLYSCGIFHSTRRSIQKPVAKKIFLCKQQPGWQIWMINHRRNKSYWITYSCNSNNTYVLECEVCA